MSSIRKTWSLEKSKNPGTTGTSKIETHEVQNIWNRQKTQNYQQKQKVCKSSTKSSVENDDKNPYFKD